MAAHAPELTRRAMAGSALWWALLCLAPACGCTSLEAFTAKTDCPPVGPAFRVVATWNNEVIFAPDPTRNGAENPGLAGRVYLFGPEISYPLGGDGAIMVDLYDETAPGSKTNPVMLEHWTFDKETLKLLQRKDMIGWGYTLFLPWGTYKPEIRQVRLQLCYQPEKGTPLYTESTRLTLTRPQDTDAFPVANKGTANGTVTPTAATQAATPPK
jgi:hypothetical protein